MKDIAPITQSEIDIKTQKLRDFANSVFENPSVKDEIFFLLRKLKLTKEEIIKSYINYDLDITTYDNEIYESLSMRFVLYLHYLLKGSWHQDRQNSVLRLVNKAKPKSIVDMGFGAPTKYIREYVLKKRIKLVLTDLYTSAFEFSSALFEFLDKDYRNFITFKQIDMNKHTYPGDFDCYIFQDSIEHVDNSTKYLYKIVNESPDKSKFIFSLPIGPLMRLHTISWETKEDAFNWLERSGLIIEDYDEVFVNPKVDLFAEQIEKEFYNLVVLCKKKVNS